MLSQRVKRVKKSKKSKMSKRIQRTKRTKRVNKKIRNRRKRINPKRSQRMKGGMEADEVRDWRSGKETSTTVGKRGLAQDFLIQSGFKKENLCDLYNFFFDYISGTDDKNYPEFKVLFDQKYGQLTEHQFGDALNYWYDVQMELLPLPIYKERISGLKTN